MEGYIGVLPFGAQGEEVSVASMHPSIACVLGSDPDTQAMIGRNFHLQNLSIALKGATLFRLPKQYRFVHISIMFQDPLSCHRNHNFFGG